MGLLDKIKDLFTDEEDISEDGQEESVKIKEIKKVEPEKKEISPEPEKGQLPTFMREKIEQEEKEKFHIDESDKEEADFNVSSRVSSRSSHNLYTEDTVELPRKDETSFKFPVEFDDSDFVPSRTKKVASIHSFDDELDKKSKEPAKEEKQKKEVKVADLYKDKSKKEEEHKFKATPIISPIYGVLDKNYSKDQIKEIDENSYVIKRSSVSKNIDFESVRKKAYGSLADDIKENLMCENCELLKEAKEEKKRKETEDNLVYDMLKDEELEEKKDITFGDATENYYDYGVPYEVPNVSEPRELKEEEAEDKAEVKILNSEEVEEEGSRKKEIPPVKSSINLLSTLKKSMGEEKSVKNAAEVKSSKPDLELTDDLFHLIDSMYDERNER